ncbi:MauE/DoxX family redox-associated membrane protein [Methylacidiphilum caldifontis]|uniref:Methylamine utilisation protein MauE domain-containing protein n=1 Tax=Methylacidiphilum caldifontis TaxID=2795386 RepID=A0A4Y8PIU2_9BACT|nr:MauE/DoxX family redox-associated membrane protein [Methylacidiphilum caldifontis]TFE71151.1 hypothetical protein A7Q10_05310 [Methylacidiphilum caldifontis]
MNFKPMIDPLIHNGLVFFLTILFFYSSIQKFFHHPYFVLSLENYRIVPAPFVKPLALLIPFVESLAAGGLFFPQLKVYGLCLVLVLLGLFSLVITIKLFQGEDSIDCGCFGPALKQKLSWILLARNFVLSCIAALLFLHQSNRALTPYDQLLSLWIAVVLFLSLSAWNQLISNQSLPLLKKKELL